jgi:hypothetical protein
MAKIIKNSAKYCVRFLLKNTNLINILASTFNVGFYVSSAMTNWMFLLYVEELSTAVQSIYYTWSFHYVWQPNVKWAFIFSCLSSCHSQFRVEFLNIHYFLITVMNRDERNMYLLPPQTSNKGIIYNFRLLCSLFLSPVNVGVL